MPKDHARKKALANLKTNLGIKHACAVALLDHPDPAERDLLEEYLETYTDVTTYREAVDYLRQQQNDPRNQLLCERCGWTVGMICPECSGCGCVYGCTGWRHDEWAHEEDRIDPVGCPDCGAGCGENPYAECCCWDDDEEDEAA
ncbi:hypothetical protein [Streptomyces kaniharaensis]|uniref:hypothetical protein n=1 Tax=Streptomyces kaniharaensis TaxID=212423 RepID=UPI0018A8583B|nr:hypothetical protein [Streptomyces kaniharaensis]